MGRWPFPTTITVSSSAISAASPPSMRRAKDRRRVRTWRTGRIGFRPAMACRRRPTGPSGPMSLTPDAGSSSQASRGCRSPAPSAHGAVLSVISSRRPCRRVRTTNPAFAIRQSSVSKYESTNRWGGWADAVIVVCSYGSTDRVGSVASHRSTGRRSSASNCHSISSGSGSRSILPRVPPPRADFGE